MIARDLIAWTKSLSLQGELASSEPKRLRYRLFHQAGPIARSGRRMRLRLERSWPWAEALVEALARIRALPERPGALSADGAIATTTLTATAQSTAGPPCAGRRQEGGSRAAPASLGHFSGSPESPQPSDD